MNDRDLHLTRSSRRRKAGGQIIAALESKSTFARRPEPDDVFEDYVVEEGGTERLCCGWEGVECGGPEVRWAEFREEEECASFNVFCGFRAWVFAPINRNEVA